MTAPLKLTARGLQVPLLSTMTVPGWIERTTLVSVATQVSPPENTVFAPCGDPQADTAYPVTETRQEAPDPWQLHTLEHARVSENAE